VSLLWVRSFVLDDFTLAANIKSEVNMIDFFV
jgi:hypothetical protein